MNEKKTMKLNKMFSKPKYVAVIQKTIKVLEIILITIILILVIGMGSIAIQSIINENESASFLGFKIYKVASGSMEDTILTGQVILVKTTKIEDLKVGDIISFKSSTATITTHRITDISTNKENGKIEITTKGDNNNAADTEKVTEDTLEGKYILTIKGAGAVMDFINTPIGLTCTVTIPILALVLIISKEKRIVELRAMRREKLTNYNNEIKRQEIIERQKEVQEETKETRQNNDNEKNEEENKIENSIKITAEKNIENKENPNIVHYKIENVNLENENEMAKIQNTVGKIEEKQNEVNEIKEIQNTANENKEKNEENLELAENANEIDLKNKNIEKEQVVENSSEKIKHENDTADNAEIENENNEIEECKEESKIESKNTETQDENEENINLESKRENNKKGKRGKHLKTKKKKRGKREK